jgi:hypothetical protein
MIMVMEKLNCWEFRKCGMEPGGPNSESGGVCPATTQERLDGTNGGKNAGRACWVVAGTMCNGELQGAFDQKHKYCSDCEFYQVVKQEEGGEVFLTFDLLQKIDAFVKHVLNEER